MGKRTDFHRREHMPGKRSDRDGYHITIKGPAAILLLLGIAGAAVMNTLVYRTTLPVGGREAIERGLALQYGIRRAAGLVPDTMSVESGEALAADLQRLDKVEILSLRSKGWTFDRIVRVEVALDGSPPPDGKPVRYLFLDCGPVVDCIVLDEVTWISYALGLWFVKPAVATFPSTI